MNKLNSIFINLSLQKILWWCSGADINVLKKAPTDWQRFSTIGLSIILSSFLAMLSVMVLFQSIINSIYLSVLSSLLWGCVIFSLNRFIAATFPKYKNYKSIFLLLPRVFLAIIISITISYPLQILLFKDSIANHLHSLQQEPPYSFLMLLTGLKELQQTNVTMAILSWLLIILFIMIELMSMLTAWLTPSGIYEAVLEHQNEKLMFESEIELRLAFDIAAKQKMFREELTKMPFGGFEFYIDYKSLLLNDVNSLFSSMNKVYETIYKIDNFSGKDVLSNKLFSDLEEVYKSHPEDLLFIHSIETGNSVTFKISTGWKPKVELIKGDFIVLLPKGSVALLVTGYLITKVFDYGVYNYKQLLEIQKLEKENTVLDNQILNEKINSFNSKLDVAPQSMKDEFQEDLYKFYELTLGNSNFNQVRITPDNAIIQKINEGKLVLTENNTSEK